MQDATHPSNEPSKLFPIGLLVLVVALFAAFWPALNSPLAFDDPISVSHVKGFKSWVEIFKPDAFNFFRPVKNLHAWLLVKADAGVVAWHLVNLAAYSLAACSVAWLAKTLLESGKWGLVVGAVWAFSATGVTVAVWLSCFNINLAVAAVATALVLQDRNAQLDRGWPWKVLAALCWLVALLSYETAIAFAPLVIALEWIRGRRLFTSQSWQRYACFAVVGLVWLVLRLNSGASSQGLDTNPANPPGLQRWQLAASAPYFLLTHLLMWAAPWNRIEFMSSYVWNESVPTIVHPFCWLLLAGLVVTLFGLKRRFPIAAFGLAWFLIGSIPSGNFIPLGNTPFADYYVPFPSVGLALLLVCTVKGLLSLRRDDVLATSTRNFATVVAVALLSTRLAQLAPMWEMIQMWRTPFLVVASSCAVRPHQFYAKGVVAKELVLRGQPELAESFALEAIAEGPHLAGPRIALGDIRDIQGRTDEAIRHFQESLPLLRVDKSSYDYSNLRLGQIYAKSAGRLDEALRHLLPVLKNHDSRYHEDAILAEVKVLELNGKHTEAMEVLAKGMEIHPESSTLQEQQQRLKNDSPAP